MTFCCSSATTSAKAKVGNYPFTTITPNRGIHLYRTQCACSKFPKFQSFCAPEYGKCVNGMRYIPIQLLDVAGLIPGASEGLGLGNKFLDDLRHAHVLIHVVDVSGTTNEKGETTEGYDPSNDIDWLNLELHSWIFNNLWKRWDSIISRHRRKKSSIVDTLNEQLSGYGCSRKFIVTMLENLHLSFNFDQKIALNTNSNEVVKHLLETWDENMLRQFVWDFLKERFPTVYACNKIDHKAAAKNIQKIFDRYDPDRIILTSALSECFLQKMKKDGYIEYNEGDSDFVTYQDAIERNDPTLLQRLKPIANSKQKQQLDSVRDFVLFRYDSTGVYQAVSKAVELQNYIAVYPVDFSIPALKQQHNADTREIHTSVELKKGLFHKVILVKQCTSIRTVVHRAYRAIFDKQRALEEENAQKGIKTKEAMRWYCETEDGRKLSETETLCNNCSIIRVVFE